jgi:hypothetical protein
MNTASLSNIFLNKRLIRPIFGLPSRIQATVKRIPGITSGITESAKNRPLNGVLVRSFIHASSVPSTKAIDAAPAAKRSEFQNRIQVSAEP